MTLHQRAFLITGAAGHLGRRSPRRSDWPRLTYTFSIKPLPGCAPRPPGPARCQLWSRLARSMCCCGRRPTA